LALTTLTGCLVTYGIVWTVVGMFPGAPTRVEPYWPNAVKLSLLAGGAFGSGPLLIWYLRRRPFWLVAALVLFAAGAAAAVYFSLQPLGWPWDGSTRHDVP